MFDFTVEESCRCSVLIDEQMYPHIYIRSMITHLISTLLLSGSTTGPRMMSELSLLRTEVVFWD